MIYTIEIPVTEYCCIPDKNNEKNIFVLNNKSLIINLCDEHENLIKQTEISLDDALKLARFILNCEF